MVGNIPAHAHGPISIYDNVQASIRLRWTNLLLLLAASFVILSWSTD
jgi:hypothetical protein